MSDIVPAAGTALVVTFPDPDLADLRRAKQLLESPSLTAQISNLIGSPLEMGFKLLPKDWNARIGGATEAALLRALQIAVSSLGKPQAGGPAHDRLHKGLTAVSGAAGGVFGLWSLPVELPVSTTLMLRSIADIASSEGQDLSLVETRLACLEVFALGGKRSSDNAAESGYWIVRASLAQTMSEAIAYVAARRELADKAAPPLVRLIAAIAARFGVQVSAEVAAKALPVVSAVSGAGVNVLFMNHFQNVARGHFILRRLEQKYGTGAVRRQYEALRY
jgi:hypothetical protein